MGEVPAKVHYHVKKLESVGILKLVYTKEINGIVAKYYEATAERFEIKSEAIDPTVEALILDETRKIMASIYDECKKVIFKSLDNQEVDDMADMADINNSTVSLTKKEAEYFSNFIKNFLEEHKSSKNTDETKRSYHFFSSFFTLNK